MNIYIIGVGGAGLGPMALLLKDAGYEVWGSDMRESLMTGILTQKGVEYSLNQDGTFIDKIHQKHGIDLVVHSSAVTTSNQDYAKAQDLGIQCCKRDVILNTLFKDKNLDLIAIAGTHGKTTTTSMMVWVLQQAGVSTSYLIGSNISFGPSAQYSEGSKVFVYEADEFDRNFLHFHPRASIITSIEYDHPDTYPTEKDYFDSFKTFIRQSKVTSVPESVSSNGVEIHPEIHIPGLYNRSNASLVLNTLKKIRDGYGWDITDEQIIAHIHSYPGVQRRFEKISDQLYSDYAHTPAELRAVISIAKDTHPDQHITIIYQPHQNIRQHLILQEGGYGDCCQGADNIFWLDTYLSREDGQRVISAKELAETLHHDQVSIVQLSDQLYNTIEHSIRDGGVVVCCGAGDIDGWLRSQLI